MLIPRDELIRQNARLEEVRDEIIAELMKIPGVVAVSDGVKRVAGSLIPEICIKVTVKKKRNLKDIPESERIPAEIKGFKTDVDEAPEGTAFADDNYYRPLVGGSAIQNSKEPGTGTLGCFAKVNTGANLGTIVILSNFHVLCSSKNTGLNNARIGQPTHSGCCECCTCNEVGRLIDGEVVDGHLDCAIARIYNGSAGDPNTTKILNSVIDIGSIAGSGPIVSAGTHYSVLPGETVYKRGRTTTFTIGTISNRGASPTITYNKDPLIQRTKVDQMEITPVAPFADFSLPGDSGSVVVNAKNEVVGLLFAGNATTHVTWANHIDYVTTRLHIDILNSLDETGLPVVTSGAAVSSSGLQKWMEEAEAMLKTTPKGEAIRALLYRHQKEIRDLITGNKEVQVAWNRYKGPQFLNYIARSVRDDQPVPASVNGVTLENLLLKMAAVLLRCGSEALAADIEKHYLHVLEIISSGNRFREWMQKLDRISADVSVNF